MPEPRHLSPETLLAYHERTLSEAEAERVRAHLVGCPRCTAVVLDYATFPDLEPPTEQHRLSRADLRSQWAEIERRISDRTPWWKRHEVLLPLAAGLFLAAVGLGVWGEMARSQLRGANSPSGAVYVAELALAAAAHRGMLRDEEVPVDVETVVLVLDPGVTEPFPAYSVDVSSSGGRRLAHGVAVRRTREGLFPLTLPRELLVPREITLELFGEKDGDRVPIEEFEVITER